ncbi:MAG TPA: protein-glutamate O-methyltransferase CheR [bacterium]|nr:protein-glutamate O-methyltransferase CheR [bacterium]HOL47409.1 protein-glutamate O-methyltransferase CheR [bacterium]HPQ18564.1 protein-glutamate O-methyltransferase CheR [bacterium]
MSINIQVNKMTDEEFKLLSEFILEITGLYYPESKKYIIEGRLSKFVQNLGFNNFKDYYYYLKYDVKKNEEIKKIIEELTTNETYFFREINQIIALRDEIFMPMLNEKKKSFAIDKRIKIWSAACSSGEEPYTIAMLLNETNSPEIKNNFTIYATDISNEMIAKAKKGVYRDFSFRSTEQKYLEKYFIKVSEGYKIKDEIQKYVTFEIVNFLDKVKMNSLKNFDIIFCRNALIYFNEKTKKEVIDSFYNSLNKNGIFFLGHSESLFRISTAFELVQFKNALGYIKK